MLPSSIGTPTDPRLHAPSQGGSFVMHLGGRSNAATVEQSVGRGPLAQRALRQLGITATGQSWRGATDGALRRAFGSEPGSDARASAWLAARLLPTPSGYVRASSNTPTWVREIAPVQRARMRRFGQQP